MNSNPNSVHQDNALNKKAIATLLSDTNQRLMAGSGNVNSRVASLRSKFPSQSEETVKQEIDPDVGVQYLYNYEHDNVRPEKELSSGRIWDDPKKGWKKLTSGQTEVTPRTAQQQKWLDHAKKKGVPFFSVPQESNAFRGDNKYLIGRTIDGKVRRYSNSESDRRDYYQDLRSLAAGLGCKGILIMGFSRGTTIQTSTCSTLSNSFQEVIDSGNFSEAVLQLEHQLKKENGGSNTQIDHEKQVSTGERHLQHVFQRSRDLRSSLTPEEIIKAYESTFNEVNDAGNQKKNACYVQPI